MKKQHQTKAAAKPDDHAVRNANGWAETIASLVAALECDYDKLEELREERGDISRRMLEAQREEIKHDELAAQHDLAAWNEEHGDELAELLAAATVDGDEFKSREDVEQRIQESPLSVQVRSGWYSPGQQHDAQPEEFEILLSTGGPALRIVGELDEHLQPHRAWLEYQNWGTPWTHHYVEGLADTLLTFCRCFYFGE